jgi:predicted DCC family thiol-disulfide oxidoreductase YuxK
VDNPADQARPQLIFDGDCGFCTTSATWIARRLHRPQGLDAELAPSQFTDLGALGTTQERAEREVLWVATDKTLYGGADAVAQWLRFRGGPYGVAGRVMGLPAVKQLAGLVYRLVAANRQRLPGGTPACALPPSGPHPTDPGRKPL